MLRSNIFIVLAIALLLLVVFITSSHVGGASYSSRKYSQLASTQRIIESRQRSLASCVAAEAEYHNTTQRDASAQRTLAAEKAALLEQAAHEDSRIGSVLRELRECLEGVRGLQTDIFGAPVSNPEGHLAKLALRRTELQQRLQLINTTGDWELMNRARAFAVQSALARETRELSSNLSRPYLTPPAPRSAVYSVVFDIGSTGNRVHVFRYRAGEDAVRTLRLEGSFFASNVDPLAACAESVERCGTHLLPLLERAEAQVSSEDQVRTPVEFRATAGLRKLGEARAAAVLAEVRRELVQRGRLWLRGAAPVAILEGGTEGYLAWLTVAYLVERAGGGGNGSGGALPATIDLGGGSTQLAMPLPPEAAGAVVMADEDGGGAGDDGARRSAALAVPREALYAHSYQGLGMREALTEVLYHVRGKCQPRPQGALAPYEPEESLTVDTAAVEHFPCFPTGYSHPLGVRRAEETPARAADFYGCVDVFRRHILHDTKPCGAAHCGSRGVAQPSLANFSGPIFAFSYIYDFMHPFVAPERAAENLVSLREMEAGGAARCAALTLDYIREAGAGGAPAGARETECMGYAYIYALLRYGYKLPEDRFVTVRKQMDGFELSWALGASLLTMKTLYSL